MNCSISPPWYVVTGNVTLDNFIKLCTQERGFIWRGFTETYEMFPSAANYNEYCEKVTCSRTEKCHPLAEIKRAAEIIYDLNKEQRFPFEIPLPIRSVLFPGFYQPDGFLKNMGIEEFPDKTLAQALSIVQHERGGTSLLDFSTNKYKALYFAIGNKDNMSSESSIFGLNVPWFETHKNDPVINEYTSTVFQTDGPRFDIIYPSYFMNNKIAHQEGVFLYQRFKIQDPPYENEVGKYENVLDVFRKKYNDVKEKKGNTMFQKVNIDEFFEICKGGCKPIFYVSLKVPAKEKPVLKAYLNSIGITDNFMQPG